MAVVVAIPARNEEDFLPGCLASLAAQTHPPDAVVVLLNNSSDASAERARSMRVPYALHVTERALPPARANAGFARRLAMRAAARLAAPDGVLLCTDADAICPPDWVAANLRAIRGGADAVAGMADLHPADAAAIPAALHEDDARECGYAALLDEIAALADPDPFDPFPRHDQHSGASIACTAAVFARVGGIPAVAHAEDRAFFAALRRVDARIRHAPDVRVTVSGRTEGRAAGGMADTIRRRLTTPDTDLDDRLEPADDFLRRVRLRRAARLAHADGRSAALAWETGLSPRFIASCLRARYAGATWVRIADASPVLQRRRVAVADLPRQVAVAGLIVATLRLSAPLRLMARTARPAGSAHAVPREPATATAAPPG